MPAILAMLAVEYSADRAVAGMASSYGGQLIR